MTETEAERRERQRISDAKRLEEMNAMAKDIVQMESKPVEQPIMRDLKAVKAELRDAGKNYKAAILSHREIMRQCREMLKPSLDNKRYWYNRKLALAKEKKEMLKR